MMAPLMQRAAAAPAGLSCGGMLVRLCGALALVILLILALAWLARRAGWTSPQAAGAPLLRIRHSQTLGQRERVVILEVQRRWLLLGVTPGGVTLLGELDPADDAAAPAGVFQQTLLRALSNRERGG